MEKLGAHVQAHTCMPLPLWSCMVSQFHVDLKPVMLFFVGYCFKTIVIFPTEAKGCLHLVRYWYSFLCDTSSASIFWAPYHIRG